MTYLEDMFGFSEKIVAIAGGAGLLAEGMAECLLKAGAKVALWGIHQKTIDEALERLSIKTGMKEKIIGVEVDASDEKALISAIKTTEKALGPPEILINSVGGRPPGSITSYHAPLVDTDIKDFEDVLRLNLVAGLLAPTKVIARYWIEKGVKGSIINIASISSYVPMPGVLAYDAAKAGVVNLTKAIANEFSTYNIRVNAIAPGFFLSEKNKPLLVNDQKTGELTDRGKKIISHTPFGRFGDPVELSGAVLFLASNKASGFVTGVCIPVDGGFLVHSI
jgi:NAD(P)-dependent dehydrogenase (short-subunit alcohol dehydrogenase family)